MSTPNGWPNDYCRACTPTLHWAKAHIDAKKIAEGVYLIRDEILVHHCANQNWYRAMTFRESDEGPMYWCEGCGYVLDNGIAMAIRLYEAPIS